MSGMLLLGLLLGISSGIVLVVLYMWMQSKGFEIFLCTLEKRSNIRLTRILMLAYVFIFILSLLVYYERANSLSRPILYFIIMAILPGILLNEIIFSPKNNGIFKIFIFFQIVMVMANYMVTLRYLYPTLIGRDPWTHSYLVANMVAMDKIPQHLEYPWRATEIVYTKLPGFHLLFYSVINVVGSINYKTAETILGIILIVGYNLLFFMFFRNIFKLQFLGFSAILLLSVADGALELTGRLIIPNSLGIFLDIIIMYFIILRRLEAKIGISLLILTLYLVITHSVSSMLLLILLGNYIIFEYMHSRHAGSSLRNLTVYLIFGGILFSIIFAWWLYISPKYLYALARIITQFYVFINSMLHFGVLLSHYGKRLVYGIPVYTIMISRSPFLLYLGLSLVGIVILLKLLETRKEDILLISTFTRYSFSIFIPLFILVIVSLFVPQLGAISHRLWGLFEMVSSGFAVVGLIWIARKIVARYSFLVFLCVLTGLIILVSILNFTSPVISEDISFSEYGNPLTALSPSETQLAMFIISHSRTNKDVAVIDFDYYRMMSFISSNLNPEFCDNLKNIRSINVYLDLPKDTLGVIRYRLSGRYFQLGVGYGSKMDVIMNPEEFSSFIGQITYENSVLYNSEGGLVWLVN